ncbi:hypothetical protein PINS_up007216 [Pythium insidiosum]|nr:hypothetical protein PINS_up007216 [Pythium insidiosum]
MASSAEDVVAVLTERQRSHPTVDAVPFAAKIRDIPIFIGDARAAKDVSFLRENNITHVVSLGTGKISPLDLEVLVVDILDMEDQLIITHFERCLAFIDDVIRSGQGNVLVHCVYGQSRSATICVAYLMRSHAMPLVDAFDAVCSARPCIYINPGFLRQLEMFERMDMNPSIVGQTNAHAELRSLLAARQRTDEGSVYLTELPAAQADTFHCSKCSFLLGSSNNRMLHRAGSSRTQPDQTCPAPFFEPMKWMSQNTVADGPDFGYEKEGKIVCPKCSSKLGTWNWIGTKCQCGAFVSPAFQLTPSRIRQRR